MLTHYSSYWSLDFKFGTYVLKSSFACEMLRHTYQFTSLLLQKNELSFLSQSDQIKLSGFFFFRTML